MKNESKFYSFATCFCRSAFKSIAPCDQYACPDILFPSIFAFTFTSSPWIYAETFIESFFEVILFNLNDSPESILSSPVNESPC